jgi:hypothetical protein
MMRCRTGTAEKLLMLSRSKFVAVPDQRRTASRLSVRRLWRRWCMRSRCTASGTRRL